MNLFVVGISGGSAAGKTTVACLLADMLGRDKASILEVDRYFLDRSAVPEKDRAGLNYDIPEALDFDRLAADIGKLKNGEPVWPPEYDYAGHSSRPSGRRLDPARTLIVEGILLFHPRIVAPLMDFKIFVEADREERLSRRIERDVAHRGRTRESVIRQFNETVEPAFIKYTLPTKKEADAVLDWNAMNYPALAAIAGRIMEIIG